MVLLFIRRLLGFVAGYLGLLGLDCGSHGPVTLRGELMVGEED